MCLSEMINRALIHNLKSLFSESPLLPRPPTPAGGPAPGRWAGGWARAQVNKLCPWHILGFPGSRRWEPLALFPAVMLVSDLHKVRPRLLGTGGVGPSRQMGDRPPSWACVRHWGEREFPGALKPWFRRLPAPTHSPSLRGPLRGVCGEWGSHRGGTGCVEPCRWAVASFSLFNDTDDARAGSIRKQLSTSVVSLWRVSVRTPGLA